MLTYVEAAILGLLQGLAELFPISSLGHTALVPAILHWPVDRASDAFLSFLVLTHLATALVLVGFFWRDWLKIVVGLLRSAVGRRLAPDDIHGRLGWLIVASTIPAGLVGLIAQKQVELLFGSARLVAIALALNGVVLFAVERLGRRPVAEGAGNDAQLSMLTFKQALGIGVWQCLALIPGFSRTGLAMTGGLVSGLNHENAARYSFLLATPIILAAAVLKVPHLILHGGAGLGPALVGAACAAIAAFASVRFLLRYFETRSLRSFAIYCIIAGLAAAFLVSI